MAISTNCESTTRRDCLRLGLGALIGGGLIDALRVAGRRRSPARRPTSCILIWMDGGPSHYETFDPKPGAPAEIRGKFSPIATKVPGIQFSEPMKRLAAIADKLAIVRSIRHDQGNHGAGNHYMMTGRAAADPRRLRRLRELPPQPRARSPPTSAGPRAACRRTSRFRACRARAGRTSWGPSTPRSSCPTTRTRATSASATSPRRAGSTTTEFDGRRDLRARVDRFRRFADKAAGDPALRSRRVLRAGV